MKIKNLIIVLVVVFILFIYNLGCYWFVNKWIDNGTKDIINDYFKASYKIEAKYDYKKAILNSDNTISVFIKTLNKDLKEYYRFTFNRNGNIFELIKVDNKIPPYMNKR